MTGKSLHIGLNYVDPNAYGGWDGALSGCINDANSMEGLASSLGYTTTKLTDAHATSHRVLQELSNAARTLVSGDIFLVTYSGHGGQVFDANSDESDAMDETWVLWDREVVDDELSALWAQFASGVRIFMLSDSCHSGTVAKLTMAEQLDNARARNARCTEEMKSKNLPREIEQMVATRDRPMYDTVQYIAGCRSRENIRASLILISGCQDNQLSYDGAVNGQFTGTLLQVWASGGFQGSYPSFHKAILNKMPPYQSPNYYTVGVTNPDFEQQKPFTIAAPAGSGATQPVGPSTPTSYTERPTLRIGDQGADVRYLQERLNAHGHSLTPDGFFGRQTQGAVRSFQASRGLTADGIVGQATWRALEGAGTAVTPTQPQPTQPAQPTEPVQPATRPTLRRGDRNEHVRYLQERLIEQGYYLTADGVFGGQTESVVRSFQRANGLVADGVVGPATWQAIESARAVATDGSGARTATTPAYA